MSDKIVVHRTDFPDSIEIGTPGRGGTIKVHFDAGDLPNAKQRIENSVAARAHMLAELANRGVHVNAS